LWVKYNFSPDCSYFKIFPGRYQGLWYIFSDSIAVSTKALFKSPNSYLFVTLSQSSQEVVTNSTQPPSSTALQGSVIELSFGSIHNLTLYNLVFLFPIRFHARRPNSSTS
jgi:hypothetical protein